MSEWKEFVEKYNGLVVGETKVQVFQLVDYHHTVLETWLTPLEDPNEIDASISKRLNTMPPGSHQLTVQAISNTGSVMGSQSMISTGRSQAARSAANDATKMAEAVAMNVDTAQQQIQMMEARAQAAETRAMNAETKVGAMVNDFYKMVDLANTMQMNSELNQIKEKESAARTEILTGIGMQLIPVAGKVAALGTELLDYKVRKAKREWEADDVVHEAEMKRKKAEAEQKAKEAEKAAKSAGNGASSSSTKPSSSPETKDSPPDQGAETQT